MGTSEGVASIIVVDVTFLTETAWLSQIKKSSLDIKSRSKSRISAKDY